jgi:predicted dehydrogenase
MEKLNIGVSGVGFMGELHAKVFSELPNAQVLAIADVDSDRARKVAEKNGVKKFSYSEGKPVWI